MKILFVCLGNICRSPMAENLVRHLGLSQFSAEEFQVDSAGTASYHIGEKPDRRTTQVLSNHGIETTGTARQVRKEDFYQFDYIMAMDKHNLSDLELMQPSDAKAILTLFRSFDTNSQELDVPDPYYGAISDFENVYRILYQSSIHFLSYLQSKK